MVLGALRRSLSFTFSSPTRPGFMNDQAQGDSGASAPGAAAPASKVPSTPTRQTTAGGPTTTTTTSKDKEEAKLFGMLLLENRKGAVMERFPVLDRQTRIGRAASAQIRIVHHRVSRTHCTIDFDGQQYKPFLHILGKHGLYVNGVHLLPTSDFEPCVSPGILPLASGDLLGIEGRYFRLECAEDGPMSLAQGVELLDSPVAASKSQQVAQNDKDRRSINPSALPRRIRLSLISSAVIDTPAKPKQRQSLLLNKAGSSSNNKRRSFPAQNSFEQIRAQGRSSVGGARGATAAGAAPSTPARGTGASQKRSAPMTEPRNAKLARGGAAAAAAATRAEASTAQMEMMMEEEEEEEEEAENLIIVEELDEDEEAVLSEEPQLELEVSQQPTQEATVVETTMLVPAGTSLEEVEQSLNSPSKTSPRKQGRRSSLFSLASINLGFYSDSPKQVAMEEKEAPSLGSEGSMAPPPPPSQPETPTRRLSKSPNKPRAILLTPSLSPSISAQPLQLQPQPDNRNVVDAYGTPRLPRSLSSPSRLNSYRRDFSLRTQALLKGCDEYLEKEARGLNVISPPPAPSFGGAGGSMTMSSLSNVLASSNVSPSKALSTQEEMEEWTPQDEDDEDEIEKSLSMPEGLASLAAVEKSRGSEEEKEAGAEGEGEEQRQKDTAIKPRTSKLPLAFMTPQPRSRTSSQAHDLFSNDALAGTSSAPRPFSQRAGGFGPRKSLGKGSRLLALRGGPSPRKTDDWARMFLPRTLPGRVGEVGEGGEARAEDEREGERKETPKEEEEREEGSKDEELQEMGSMIEDLMDGQGEVDTDEEEEEEAYPTQAQIEPQEVAAEDEELPEAEPMDLDPLPRSQTQLDVDASPRLSHDSQTAPVEVTIAQEKVSDGPPPQLLNESVVVHPIPAPAPAPAPTPTTAGSPASTREQVAQSQPKAEAEVQIQPPPPSTPRYGALRDLITQSPAHQQLLSVSSAIEKGGKGGAKASSKAGVTATEELAKTPTKTPSRRTAKTPASTPGQRTAKTPSRQAAPTTVNITDKEQIQPEGEVESLETSSVPAAAPSASLLTAQPTLDPKTPSRARTPSSSKLPSTAAAKDSSRVGRSARKRTGTADTLEDEGEVAVNKDERLTSKAESRTPAADRLSSRETERRTRTPRTVTRSRTQVEEGKVEAEEQESMMDQADKAAEEAKTEAEAEAASSPCKSRSNRTRTTTTSTRTRMTRAKTAEPESEAEVVEKVQEEQTGRSRRAKSTTKKVKKAEAEPEAETEAEVESPQTQEAEQPVATTTTTTTRRTRTRSAAVAASSGTEKSTTTRGRGKKVDVELQEDDDDEEEGSVVEEEEAPNVTPPGVGAKPRRARAAKIKASDAITATIDPAAAAAAAAAAASAAENATTQAETAAEGSEAPAPKKRATRSKGKKAAAVAVDEQEEEVDEEASNSLKESSSNAKAAEKLEEAEGTSKGKARAATKGRTKTAAATSTVEDDSSAPSTAQTKVPKARRTATATSHAASKSSKAGSQTRLTKSHDEEEQEEDEENRPPSAPATSDTGYEAGASSSPVKQRTTRGGVKRSTRSARTASALGARR